MSQVRLRVCVVWLGVSGPRGKGILFVFSGVIFFSVVRLGLRNWGFRVDGPGLFRVWGFRMEAFEFGV